MTTTLETKRYSTGRSLKDIDDAWKGKALTGTWYPIPSYPNYEIHVTGYVRSILTGTILQLANNDGVVGKSVNVRRTLGDISVVRSEKISTLLKDAIPSDVLLRHRLLIERRRDPRNILVYKPIPGYPHYEISECGTVRSSYRMEYPAIYPHKTLGPSFRGYVPGSRSEVVRLRIRDLVLETWGVELKEPVVK